jgi:hypothetical protein
MQRIFIKECFLFMMESVCRVKWFTTGPGNVANVYLMAERFKWKCGSGWDNSQKTSILRVSTHWWSDGKSVAMLVEDTSRIPCTDNPTERKSCISPPQLFKFLSPRHVERGKQGDMAFETCTVKYRRQNKRELFFLISTMTLLSFTRDIQPSWSSAKWIYNKKNNEHWRQIH